MCVRHGRTRKEDEDRTFVFGTKRREKESQFSQSAASASQPVMKPEPDLQMWRRMEDWKGRPKWLERKLLSLSMKLRVRVLCEHQDQKV